MGLKRQLDTASPAALASIRAEVASCVAAATRIAQQAQIASSTGQGTGVISLAAASGAVRASVTSFMDDYYQNKKFDAYLHFSSPDDEEEFRKREAERKAEMEEALALHTPEGDLQAATLAQEQVKDAGAHGATASPDFKATLAGIAGARENLQKAIETEASRNVAVADPVKMQPDPLDTIKPSLNVSRHEIAKLRASGVILAESGTGHGVSATMPREESQQR